MFNLAHDATNYQRRWQNSSRICAEKKRVDFPIEWHQQHIFLELKVKYLTEGLEQTALYMDINNATEGHLVIFDRSSTKSWDEKIYSQKQTVMDRMMFAWGM